MTTDLRKRAFYLMMSVHEGQDLPGMAGMVPASEEVAEAEGESIGAQWAILYQAGILDGVFEGAEWFADLSMIHHDIEHLVSPESLEAARSRGFTDDDIMADCHQQVQRTIGAFGVALIHKLMSEGRIAATGRFLS